MLIGKTSKKPNLRIIKRIKVTLRDVLDLPEEAIVTVTQLACLEEDCAPLETVFGLLRSDAPQLQYKVHKESAEITAEDMHQVCKAWGFTVGLDKIHTRFEEK